MSIVATYYDAEGKRIHTSEESKADHFDRKRILPTVKQATLRDFFLEKKRPVRRDTRFS
jgi:hypothetical protein